MKITSPSFWFLALVFVVGCSESQPELKLVDSSDLPANVDKDDIQAIASLADPTSTAGSESVTEPEATNQLDSTPIGKSDYRLLSWNVESDGADSAVIATQLGELNHDDHYDVFTLTEVLAADFDNFQKALGQHYKYVYSRSGNSDRLQILYNEEKFELVRHFEIQEINILNRYRAPLVAHLRDNLNGTEFLVMVNHLARGKSEIREQQATMLVEWARDQTIPVFALGDYNFDYVFETRKGNSGFVNMMRDNIWRWIEPTELIDTNWYDDPREPDGKDDFPGSILDFAFVAGPAKDWKSVCNVIVRDGDFPDDKTTSDHRPFELIISK